LIIFCWVIIYINLLIFLFNTQLVIRFEPDKLLQSDNCLPSQNLASAPGLIRIKICTSPISKGLHESNRTRVCAVRAARQESTHIFGVGAWLACNLEQLTLYLPSRLDRVRFVQYGRPSTAPSLEQGVDLVYGHAYV
jgi:hypothetical protein